MNPHPLNFKYAIRRLLVATAFLLASVAQAQTTPKPLVGYTYRVETGAAGKLVYISGQRPFNANGELVGAGDLSAQTRQVFDNLRTALAQVGMTLSDVRQVTYHLKGEPGLVNTLASQQAAGVGAGYLTQGINPALQDVKSVAQIVQDGVLIEVEVVAVK